MAEVPVLRQGPGSAQGGQPGSTPSYEELVDRVVTLERQLREGTIDLDRLPLTDLLRKLEAVWQPEPSDIIGPGGVVGSRLATDAVTSRTLGPQVSARTNFNANYNVANTGNPHNVSGNVAQIDVHPDDLPSAIDTGGFTIPVQGLYLIYQHQLALTNLANGLLEVYALVNGNEVGRMSVSWQGGQNQSLTHASIWPCVKDDFISFQVSNFTGANPTPFWSGNYWGIHRLCNF